MPEGQMHNANALTPAQAAQYWRDGYLANIKTLTSQLTTKKRFHLLTLSFLLYNPLSSAMFLVKIKIYLQRNMY